MERLGEGNEMGLRAMTLLPQTSNSIHNCSQNQRE